MIMDYEGNRLTRRLDDGRIAARLDGRNTLEKLWAYEETGYEPEEIAPYRPHLDLIKAWQVLAEKSELPCSEERMEWLKAMQAILDREYETGFADGMRASRPEGEKEE